MGDEYGLTAQDYEDAEQGSWFGRSEPPETVSYTPADRAPRGFFGGASSPPVQWDKLIDKGISAWLQNEQLQAQRQLLMAGRTVGYNPLYPLGYPAARPITLNPQLILVLGLGFLAVKALGKS